MYYGTIEESHAKSILSMRNETCIDGLKHMIFDFPPELILRSIEEQKRIRDIIKEEGIDYKQYLGTLRDYQTVGTAFMFISPRSIIADGVGLGKTAEIAALINFLKQNHKISRFLMAVETSALGQTQAELIRFTGLNIVTLPSEAPKMRHAIRDYDWGEIDGIIIKHSALRSSVLSNWVARNLNEDDMCKIFNTFILDESSVIKNNTSKVYDYTSNICDVVERVHLMNATTFETNIMNIYYQVDMMDKNILPRKWRIEREYCTYKSKQYWTKAPDEHGVMKPKLNTKWDRSGYKNQEKFKKLLKLVYFGRCKADIGMDMPHIYKVYEVEPTNDQSMALSKGYRYMEVLNSPGNIKELNIKTNRSNVPKIDRLCTLIENDFAGMQVMVYCFHLEAQEAIAKELIAIGRKPCILNGSKVDRERTEIIDGFNTGKYDVIITNIKKSINLYGGDVCIFYSAEQNPAKLEQIRGRVDRNTDDRLKTFVMLLYRGTDEYRYFMSVVRQRAKDARDLTIDSKSAVDYFVESMQDEEVKED